MAKAIVEVYWAHPETGEDFIIKCEYTPGSKDYFDRSYGTWVPGDPPDVEVLSVREDKRGGVNRDDVLAYICGDDKILDHVYEAASIAVTEE